MLKGLFLTVLASGLLVQATPVPMPAPTGVPTTATANTELAGLTVAAAGSQDGYARDLFPTVRSHSLHFTVLFLFPQPYLAYSYTSPIHPKTNLTHSSSGTLSPALAIHVRPF